MAELEESLKKDDVKDKVQRFSSEISEMDGRLKKSSEQLKEFSSFLSRPLATSSPLSHSSVDVQLLKSLMPPEKSQTHLSRGGDVFLKPLPASPYFRRPMVTAHHLGHHHAWGYPNPFEGCFNPFDYYMFSQLYRSRSEPSAVGSEVGRPPSEPLSSSSERDEVAGILKKSKDASLERSSPIETAKEIKVYQSGGVLILQNIPDGLPEAERKGLSEISSKLIEDCHKLSEGLKEDLKEAKVVQFDLAAPGSSSPKGSPAKDSNGGGMDTSFRSRDQPSSLSTNDSSLPWQQPVGLSSPSSSTSARRLEWDSGADVGYLNMDMSKDTLSTIERVTLQGLAREGKIAKKVVYKTSRGDRVLERIPSDLLESEERRPAPVYKDTGTNPERDSNTHLKRDTSDSNTQTTEETEPTLRPESVQSSDGRTGDRLQVRDGSQTSETKASDHDRSSGTKRSEKVRKTTKSQSRSSSKVEESGPRKKEEQLSKLRKGGPGGDADSVDDAISPACLHKIQPSEVKQKEPSSSFKFRDAAEIPPVMKDQSTLVSTLGDEFGFVKFSSSESSCRPDEPKVSPRVRKLKKKKPFEMSARSQKIKQIIEIVRSFPQTDEMERRVDEITVDHSFHEEVEKEIRPISASGSSVKTVQELRKSKRVDEKMVQTSDRGESKAVQVDQDVPSRKSSKNIQASGELNSLPKHLDGQKLSEMTGREVRTKSTQFFGDGANSLPRALTNVERIKKGEGESSKKDEKKLQKTQEKFQTPKEEKGTSLAKKEKEGEASNLEESGRLTVEVLRQRRETVDRSILTEKFFESQRKMVSRSTSMDAKHLVSTSTSMEPLEKLQKSASTSMERVVGVSQSTSMKREQEQEPVSVVAAKDMVSVGVQYSPKDESAPSAAPRVRTEERRVSDSQQPLRDVWTDTLDSQASSTQTADSWVHGGAPARPSVVRPTRSFEYLPGDVYESSGNLREKLPSETSQNVITESSSSADSDTQPPTAHSAPLRHPTDSGGVENESVHLSGGTVVLDDSNPSTPGAWLLVAGDSSHDIKIVRRNLIGKKPNAPETNLANGVSEVSGRWESSSSVRSKAAETSPKDAVHEPPKNSGRVDKKSTGSRSGSSKTKDGSDASKCSAGVQTDSVLDGLVPGSDLVRILREIEQALLSKSSSRRRGSVTALSPTSKPKEKQGDSGNPLRMSSSTSSLKSSASCLASPPRDENYLKSMKNVGQKSRDSVDSPERPLDVRASSTPNCVKSTGENEQLKVSSDVAVISQSDSVSVPTSAEQKSSVIDFDGKETDYRTPRLESVGSQAQAPEKTHQGTQMSARGSQKDIATSPLRLCQTCSCLPCTCRPASSRMSKEEGTQISPQPCHMCQKPVCACSLHTGEKPFEKPCPNCKKAPCTCRSSSDEKFCSCKKTLCRCRLPSERSSLPESHVCRHCKKSSCGCQMKRDRPSVSEKSPSSGRQLKEINGEVFATHLDVDFTSSEVISSYTTGSDNKSRDSSRNKENAQCTVCRCPNMGEQACVFCVCHIDKKTHIPRCDCHDKIPRILIPGFCKCHKRNLRHFDKCNCAEQVDMTDVKKCPCCQYFASRMRASLIAAQLEGSCKSSKRPEPLPPKKYFLKFEETEVSKDSSETSETERRPLEVVTIKIPVKRMGKARVPCRQFYYSGDVQHSNSNHEKEVEYLDDIVKKYTGLLSSRRSGLSKDDYIDLNRKEGRRSDKETGRSSSSYRTLQECLESNRPDFFNSAEYRRQVIAHRARERERRQQQQMAGPPPVPKAPERIFTTAELRKQTLKKCKRLSEVTQKKYERKKRELYRTNKLKAEIFAKKLQLKTLRGQLDLSNSCNLLTN